MDDYDIAFQKFIDEPWLNMTPLYLGNVPPGLGTPKVYGIVKKAGKPFMLLNVYSDYSPVLPPESLVWNDWLFIVFGEVIHWVSLTTFHTFSHELTWYCSGFYSLENYLLVSTAADILCFDKNAALLWISEEVGIDGVKIEKILENTIRGLGEWDPPGGWRPFELDFATGKKRIKVFSDH
jgi:hypothetical protein